MLSWYIFLYRSIQGTTVSSSHLIGEGKGGGRWSWCGVWGRNKEGVGLGVREGDREGFAEIHNPKRVANKCFQSPYSIGIEMTDLPPLLFHN